MPSADLAKSLTSQNETFLLIATTYFKKNYSLKKLSFCLKMPIIEVEVMMFFTAD